MPSSIQKWIGVVIIDHPRVPRGYIPSLSVANPLPCVVMLRRDWEYLFDHLRSTRTVLSYLERVVGDELPLGNEPARYVEQAIADEQAPPIPPIDGVAAFSESFESHPISPLRPIKGDDLFFRQMLEDVSSPDVDPDDEWDRVRMLMHLDTVPALTRAELGAALTQFLEAVENYSGDGFLTFTRVFIPGDGRTPILFMAASGHATVALECLHQRTFLLQFDHYSATGSAEAGAVGVLFTPSLHPTRKLDTSTCFVERDLILDEENAREVRAQFYAARSEMAPEQLGAV